MQENRCFCFCFYFIRYASHGTGELLLHFLNSGQITVISFVIHYIHLYFFIFLDHDILT